MDWRDEPVHKEVREEATERRRRFKRTVNIVVPIAVLIAAALVWWFHP